MRSQAITWAMKSRFMRKDVRTSGNCMGSIIACLQRRSVANLEVGIADFGVHLVIHLFVQYLIFIIVVVVGAVYMCISAKTTLYAERAHDRTHICAHLHCSEKQKLWIDQRITPDILCRVNLSK